MRKTLFLLPAVLFLVTAPPLRSDNPAGVWKSLGPDGGPVRDLVIDPNDSSSAFALADVGLFRTADGGETWMFAAIPSTGVHVSAITFHPSIRGILYLGTQGSGVFKSSDGGVSWTASGLAGKSVTFVGVPRSAPTTLFAVENMNLWRSTDSGLNWDNLHSILSPQVAFDPSGKNLYASATRLTVLRSSDGGQTWVEISPTAEVIGLLGPITVSPSDPSVLLLGAGPGIYRSSDGGSSWVPSNTGFSGPLWATNIVFDPKTLSRVAATIVTDAQSGVAFSDDAGLIWRTTLLDILPSPSPNPAALAFDPGRSSTIAAAIGGRGLYRSIDGGATWTPSNAGLRGQRVLSIAFEPGRSQVMYVGTDSGEIHKSNDRGQTLEKIYTGIRTVQAIAVSPLDRNRLFAVMSYGLYRSDDGGRTWQIPPFDPKQVFAPWDGGVLQLFADPQDASAVLAASNLGFFRSSDGGREWQQLFGFNIRTVALDVASPRTYYLLTNDGYVRKSLDAGKTWDVLFGYAGIELIAPADETAVFLGDSIGILDKCGYDGDYRHCLQGTDYLPGMVAKALLPDPITPNIFYAGFADENSGTGRLMRSTDSGANFSDFVSSPEILRNQPVYTFAAKPGRLYAGALGGLFQIDTESCARCPEAVPFR